MVRKTFRVSEIVGISSFRHWIAHRQTNLFLSLVEIINNYYASIRNRGEKIYGLFIDWLIWQTNSVLSLALLQTIIMLPFGIGERKYMDCLLIG